MSCSGPPCAPLYCAIHRGSFLVAVEGGQSEVNTEMGRGRGKGKRGGRGGGGRQHFVSSLEELESRNDRDEAWAARRKAERLANGESSGDEDGEDKKKGDDSESEEEGSSSEGEGARGAGASGAAEEVVMEKKQPKAKGVSSLIEVANPNAKPAAGRMMKAKVCWCAGVLGWEGGEMKIFRVC